MPMLQQPAPSDAERFGFAPPKLIPDNPHDLDSDVGRAHAAAQQAIERAKKGSEQLAQSADLTELGKRRQFTSLVGADAMTQLADADRRITEALDATEREMEELAAAAYGPEQPEEKVSDVERMERLELAKAFAALPKAERDRALTDAISGRDPALRAALATVHPAISQVSAPVQATLRRSQEGAHVDEEKLATLQRHHFALTRSQRFIDETRRAVVGASDYSALQEKGLVPKRARDMTPAEKAQFIGKHGRDAYIRHQQTWG